MYSWQKNHRRTEKRPFVPKPRTKQKKRPFVPKTKNEPQKMTKHIKRILPISDQMLVSGSHFIIGILLARALGLSVYGVFAVAWMVVLFANSLQQAFILIPMMTFAPQKTKEEKKTYLQHVFFLQLGIIGIATIFTLLFCQLSSHFSPEWNITHLTTVLPFTIILFLIHDFLRKQLYVKENIEVAFILDALAYFPQLLFLAFSYLTNTLTLYKSLWMINAGYLLAILFNLRISLKGFSMMQLREVYQQHWHFAKWLLGKTLLQWFSGNLFIVAAAALLGPVAVGAIRLAQNVMGVVNVFFIAIENYIPIQAAKLYAQEGKAALFHYLKKITWQGGILASFLVAVICTFSAQIILHLYGLSDVESIFLLRGFALLSLVVFIGIPLRFAIRTLEQTQSIFIAYVFSTAFSFCCAYPMVKYWGLWGVISGLIIAQIIMQVWYIVHLRFWSEKSR